MSEWIKAITDFVVALRNAVLVLGVWNACLTIAVVFLFLSRGTSRKPPTRQ